MKQPLGTQCSAQEEPALQIRNPQALQDLPVQTCREHRRYEFGINSEIWETRRHSTQSGDHSQSRENRGLIKKNPILTKLNC